MQLQSHIISDIPVFQIGESLEKVIKFFNENTFSHVAVVENDVLIGVLNEDDLETFDSEKTIEAFRFNLESVFVLDQTSWLDVLETFARNEANLIPVIDENGKVMGYYNLTDIVGVFIDTPFFTDPGSILVVAKGIKDYSFSEIAQIVESNNTRFIGGFITEMHNDVVQITIKIGTANLNDMVQTFRRYNYGKIH